MNTPALPGLVVTPTPLAFDTLVQRLEDAVRARGLLLVATASASRNAVARGLTVPVGK